ncbi:hypothetical protein PTI98_000247 [Pleurotus ostreatus]|nr:hypothetical protein PTI98_000247 [Pleurotus ostreatus]
MDTSTITGPLALGYMLGFVLFGVLVTQISFYTTHFPNDARIIKVVVWSVGLLEALFTVFTVVAGWNNFGTNWGDMDTLQEFHWSWLVLPLMSGPVIFATQTFFAWRIARISAKIWLGLPFVVLALLQYFAYLYWSIGTLVHGRTVDQFQSYRRIVDLELVTGLVCNLLITVAMSTMTLMMPEMSYRLTYNQIAQLSVETNVFLTIGSMIELILWRTMPHNGFHFMLFLILGRLYANILLASLNSRIHYSTSQNSSFESRNGATLWADMSRREIDINTIRSGIMNVQANAIINTHHDSEYGFQPSSLPDSKQNAGLLRFSD